jgi:hypothetical protein
MSSGAFVVNQSISNRNCSPMPPLASFQSVDNFKSVCVSKNLARKRAAPSAEPEDSVDESEGSDDGSENGAEIDWSAKAASPARPPKRARENAPRAAPLAAHTRDTLSQLSHAELIDVAEALAKRVRVLETSRLPTTGGLTNAPALKTLTAEALAAQVSKVCAIANKGIRSQLKWKQSCKAGCVPAMPLAAFSHF